MPGSIPPDSGSAWDRTDPPTSGSERELLAAWLDFHRATVFVKVAGLTGAEATRHLVPSPLTTCAGIVRHLRYVERWWFQEVLEGLVLPPPEPAGQVDAEFVVSDTDDLGRLLDEYRQECERSREVFERWDLEAIARNQSRAVSCRWVMLHMIEETARHNGHLDILRELTDGRTGE